MLSKDHAIPHEYTINLHTAKSFVKSVPSTELMKNLAMFATLKEKLNWLALIPVSRYVKP